MSEIKIKYKRWTCSECGDKFSNKQGASDKCPSCLMPYHRKLADKIGTHGRLRIQTKINYDKYIN